MKNILKILAIAAFLTVMGTPCVKPSSKQSEQNNSIFTKEQQDSMVLKRKEIQLEQLQNEKANLEKRIAETERYIDSCKAVK